jgi:hypothetical protein
MIRQPKKPSRPLHAPQRSWHRDWAHWRAGAISLGLGFFAGIAFWHTVGFWNFVTDAVLNGTTASRTNFEPEVRLADRSRSPAPSPRAGACTSLHIDASSGETKGSPCPPMLWHMRHAGVATRADRLASPDTATTAVAGWTVAVETRD